MDRTRKNTFWSHNGIEPEIRYITELGPFKFQILDMNKGVDECTEEELQNAFVCQIFSLNFSNRNTLYANIQAMIERSLLRKTGMCVRCGVEKATEALKTSAMCIVCHCRFNEHTTRQRQRYLTKLKELRTTHNKLNKSERALIIEVTGATPDGWPSSRERTLCAQER